MAAAGYIVFIVLILRGTNGFVLKSQMGMILIPMVVLSMLVLSAAIMGFLFLSEPLRLLIENKKREAFAFFAKVVGFFSCFLLLFVILLLILN